MRSCIPFLQISTQPGTSATGTSNNTQIKMLSLVQERVWLLTATVLVWLANVSSLSSVINVPTQPNYNVNVTDYDIYAIIHAFLAIKFNNIGYSTHGAIISYELYNHIVIWTKTLLLHLNLSFFKYQLLIGS